MRAGLGAIERVKFYRDEWHLSTIGGSNPVGLCGSGILDVVAALLESDQMDAAGRFTDNAVKRIDYPEGGAIILVSKEVSGIREDILVTRSDIREIQLAKAAIQAGIAALLRVTHTNVEEIDHFIIAGAFGTYLSIDSAIRIGMFPSLPKESYHQIGNAAGSGAQQMLLSYPTRKVAESIISHTDYLELTTDPRFMESFVESMMFGYYRSK
jgi:uncharacterized 2Fe-2S/4Fe-4S cluster protein (DUF4445 family)